MKRNALPFVCLPALLLIICLSPQFAWAAGPGKGHGARAALSDSSKGDKQKGRGKPGKEAKGEYGHAAPRTEVHRSAGPVSRDAWRDRDHCRVVVTEYYGRRPLPPGLAKKHSLPPGLRKQLRERGHLPPGLERYWVPVPVELVRVLPPLPPHHIWRCVDDDLIVVDVRTNFVVSIMAGVFIHL